MDARGQDSAVAPHLQVVTVPKAMVLEATPFAIRTDAQNCARGKAWKGFPANTSSFMVTQAFPGVFCTFSLKQSLSPKAPSMASGPVEKFRGRRRDLCFRELQAEA